MMGQFKPCFSQRKEVICESHYILLSDDEEKEKVHDGAKEVQWKCIQENKKGQ
jgi:hypothetical protein